jgi:hypothetical protein
VNNFIDELKRRTPFDRMRIEHTRWLVAHLDRVEFPKDAAVLSPAIPCDILLHP